MPDCGLCGHPQTFFLQIAFPDDHPWSGLSLAVFACTSCADENHLIPEMLTGSLPGADIPAGFLDRYQRNFRFEVFETSRAELAESQDHRRGAAADHPRLALALPSPHGTITTSCSSPTASTSSAPKTGPGLGCTP